MRTVLPFYTVLLEEGFPVTYIDPTTWRVKRLSGPFADPGEASREFCARIGGPQSCFLAPADFPKKARALGKLRRSLQLRERVSSQGGQR